MQLFAFAQRIRHLARYFGVLALICLAGYWFSPFSYFLLIFLAPPFVITAWLRVHGGPLLNMIPSEPLYNNFALLLPVTVIYFGLVGFQLKNILNERGNVRLFSLLLFLGFLAYVHLAAFREVSLYWEGSGGILPFTGWFPKI